MATRQQFCEAMEEVYKNHGVYIGTANGEYTESLTVGKIRQMEVDYGYDKKKTDTNIRRDFAYIGKCYENGWDMSKSRAGDCSGIIVGVMRDLEIIKPTSDYSAKMFQKAATPVWLKELKDADLVFDKTSNAGHVGVFYKGYIIESRGRDYGVTKRPLADTAFVVGGRLDWFDDDVMVLTRILKYIPDNMMRGEDVRAVQQQLQLSGYTPGTADGVYGKKTKIAVQAFQLDNGLEADGIVGKNTATALGFKWEG